jgi:type III secretion protein T
MGESYISIFLNSSLASATPLAALSLFLLFLARILPIIALSPFFGSRVLPHPVKVAFGICLFVIFLPKLLEVTKTPPNFNPFLILLAVKEIFIGLIIGNMISFPFIIAQTAGMMIDHQRGGASLMVNDPTIQNQSSPLGTLFNTVLIYVFFLIDGPFLFINAILLSFDLVPPDQLINSNFFSTNSAAATQVIRFFNEVMIMSVQLATPALIAILMTDSFLGLANRLAPQVQITFLGMPLKSLLGLAVLTLGWKLVVKQMLTGSNIWLNKLAEMIKLFHTIGT